MGQRWIDDEYELVGDDETRVRTIAGMLDGTRVVFILLARFAFVLYVN